MIRRLLCLGLFAFLLSPSFGVSVMAIDRSEAVAKLAKRVKTSIQKLGSGKDARIEGKLKDGTKFKGYVNEVRDESFVVIDDKTGQSREITYNQTKQVKGNNLSTGAKIAIAAGIIAAIIAFIVIAGNSD